MIEYIGYPDLRTFKVAVKHLNECHIFFVADPDDSHALTKENGVLYEISCLCDEGKKAFLKAIRDGSDENGYNLDIGLKCFKLKKPIKADWFLFGMFGIIKSFPEQKE